MGIVATLYKILINNGPLAFSTYLTKKLYFKFQNIYNQYIKRYYLIDNTKDTEVSIILLAGKYDYLWDITFKRIYEYGGFYNVIVVNPGGLNREQCLRLVKEYGWSYFESFPPNIESAENFVINNIIKSKIIIKVDDDVFVTKYTFKKLLSAYQKIKKSGINIGFLAPVLNVNTFSYYYFLKTLNLLEQYSNEFEYPVVFRIWNKQRIWYDPYAAIWIWRHSLPLNDTAEIFRLKNKNKIIPIPVRFSISLILFERSLLLHSRGFIARDPKIGAKYIIEGRKDSQYYIPKFPYNDETSLNFYSDVVMRGRFLVLDAFAGHFSYFPQENIMKKWFQKNIKKFTIDLDS